MLSGRTARFFVFALLTPSACLAQESIGCYVDGECTFSLVLGEGSADTPMECLEQCQNLEDDNPCAYFTHYTDSGLCLLLGSCAELSTSCTDCISGDSTCPTEICFVSDLGCQGTSVGVFDGVASAEDCLELCQSTDGCGWFTYDADSGGACILTEDCVDVVDCEGCVMGTVDCEAGGETETEDTIFVAGGTDGFDIGTAEVLRLTVGGPDYFCRDVPDLTEDAYDMQGMTDDEGRPMACGGFGNVDGTYCQVYDADSRTWEEGPRMVYSRDKSATVLLADGRYWISGGFATPESEISSEFFDGVSFTEGPTLPVEMYGHCAAEYEDNKVFLANFDSQWVVDLSGDEAAWTQLPLMPGTASRRSDGACGAVKASSGGGMDLIFAGGRETDPVSTVTVYNTASGEWRDGPDLPLPAYEMAYLPFGDSFVLVGGLTDDRDMDEIFGYDPQQGEWFQFSESLSERKRSVAAFSVGEEYCESLA